MSPCIVVKAEDNRLDLPSLEKISDTVASGGIIAYPTDTFYALGADPTNPEAVDKIYRVKGRERRKPLLCIISELEAVLRLTAGIPQVFGRISEEFWPGPLTIVFKASSVIPRTVLGDDGTIGLRLPNVELPRRVAAVCGSFVTGTSANRSGEVPPDRADLVKRDMGSEIDLLVDNGTIAGGRTSTILDLSSDLPRLVREGSIPKEDLERVLDMAL